MTQKKNIQHDTSCHNVTHATNTEKNRGGTYPGWNKIQIRTKEKGKGNGNMLCTAGDRNKSLPNNKHGGHDIREIVFMCERQMGITKVVCE